MGLAVCASAAQFVPYVAFYKILEELAANASNLQLLDKELIWRWGFISLGGIFLFGVLIYTSSMLSHIAAFRCPPYSGCDLGGCLSSAHSWLPFPGGLAHGPYHPGGVYPCGFHSGLHDAQV
jgi:hypothetical protein